ncbi:FecCD family ABC transporter permease [Acetonema longum]|uniref:Iron compound ABC transporter, permease protein n=1 Tax=Acetonema longum DSM 6540 TaxID=1009370 RepID=F7NM62_9FIRM|nr:iron ABC transporter permease [Acetonema longum]EGO62863.1 iron compound ABC transporter, permease protein [Acetonema longum DSM 6540]
MHRQSTSRFTGTMITGILLVAATVCLSLSYGIFELTLVDLGKIFLGLETVREHEVLIYDFRLPRIVIAALVGAGLAIAGAVLQGISRNGLADPGLLGINAGAGLAIVIFMFFYQGKLMGTDWRAILAMPFFGLAGGLGAVALIYLFGWKNGRMDPQRFLLTGVALGSGFGALSLYITLKMNPADFHSATVWGLGSLLHANWDYIFSMLPWFLLLCPVIFLKGPILDLFGLDEGNVRSLGVAVEKEQIILLVCSAGLVSACVSVAGSISFVGLIVPHIVKQLVGIRHDRVIPACAVGGMLLVLAADFIARNLFAPVEIAVGVIISLIGIPYFIYLLFQAKHQR